MPATATTAQRRATWCADVSAGTDVDLAVVQRTQVPASHAPATASAFNLRLMRLIDEPYTKTPFDGWPRMTAYFRRLGLPVHHTRVQRLMRVMGLQAIDPKPHTSPAANEHKIYPYLLGAVALRRPNQVWSADITDIRLATGFRYLVAIIDWWSRYGLAWQLSHTRDVAFCLEALERALGQDCPEMFNTDQGVQLTSPAFTSRLERAGIAISMDGRGRALDHIVVERLWRTVKYEDMYLHDDVSVPALAVGLGRSFVCDNHERPHQSLGYRTPAEAHGKQ